MKIRITKPFVLGAGRVANVGDIIDAPGDITLELAKHKIAKGDAIAVKEAPKEADRPFGDTDESVEKSPAAVKTRDPQVTNRAPRHKR